MEVFSTDAEAEMYSQTDFGRPVNSIGYIVDLATLTGAVVTALGNQISGMWSNNEVLQRMKKAASRCQESVWRMPLNSQFRRYMTDSAFADMERIYRGKSWFF